MTRDWTGSLVVECPLCSSSEVCAAGKRKDGAAISRCLNCGLGFLNPMPTDSEIAGMYSSYYSRADGIGYEKYPVRRPSRALDHLLWDCIRSYSQRPSTLLDVGCAFGNRVDFFRGKGLRSSGIDLSEEAVRYGREHLNLDLHLCRFEDFEAVTNYDVVLMIDFIEHLRIPNSWIEKTRPITHKDSLLLILTPDFDCHAEHGDNWIGYNMSFEHVLFYNRQSLNYLLRLADFEIVKSVNVRTMPLTMDDRPRPSRIQSLMTRIGLRFVCLPLRELRADIWMSVSDKLTWQKLTSSDSRQNSLLIVARRIK